MSDGISDGHKGDVRNVRTEAPAPAQTICSHRWIERDEGRVCDWCGTQGVTIITAQAPALDGQWHSASVVTKGNLDHLKVSQAPAPVDVGLVERMIDVWFEESPTRGSHVPDHVKRMTAALRVAADVLLGPVTEEEWRIAEHEHARCFTGRPDIDVLLRDRRARFLATAKTAEERVTVQISGPGTFGIWLDNTQKNLVFGHKEDAEIYRLGLIATLNQEGVNG